MVQGKGPGVVVVRKLRPHVREVFLTAFKSKAWEMELRRVSGNLEAPRDIQLGMMEPLHLGRA
ncbi:hypothetical protein BRADI_3g51394v3 [Brachypodium distachyon]|uniref:Uncharacterized protein n=1 Tax=Brachypodium distachyon TaxID=15368 RepID=A0A2K2D4K6_BRADI|nr:hypothetical protein BRADI_3g51394v3 [Brachypodium distachyon]